MLKALEINGLCKVYPAFSLDNVTFSLEAGKIMGFIGRNGAGKTTTIKSVLNLVHPNSGEIKFFGKNFSESEESIKNMIGYASGGNSYYVRKRIKDIVSVTKGFYKEFDDSMYKKYMALFSLDENKKIIELSEGMKVKFQLVLALSHHARLLILDEPTSGLDPISRDELLESFLALADEGVAVLFSTHITSDLDKCAEFITYIQNGKIAYTGKRREFVDSYRLVSIRENFSEEQKKVLIGIARSSDGSTAIIKAENSRRFSHELLAVPDLETVMIHLEKEHA